MAFPVESPVHNWYCAREKYTQPACWILYINHHVRYILYINYAVHCNLYINHPMHYIPYINTLQNESLLAGHAAGHCQSEERLTKLNQHTVTGNEVALVCYLTWTQPGT